MYSTNDIARCVDFKWSVAGCSTTRFSASFGERGEGEVWLARNTKLDREVTLKVLPEEFASDPR